MALALSGTSNGSLNNLSLSGNTATIVDTGRAGGVIQVVTATLATSTSFTSSTYTDLGLSASITPSSTSNKIFVISTLMNIYTSASNTYYGAQILRGSTKIQEVQSGSYNNNTTPLQLGAHTFTVLDSPSTTSSTTYKWQIKNEAATGTIKINGNEDVRGPSTITLLEVVA
jgi:hypothetical protein